MGKGSRSNSSRMEKIIRDIQYVEESISKAFSTKENLDVEGLSTLVRDFKTKVQLVLGVDEYMKNVAKILNDTYYFPRSADIADYIEKCYSTKIPKSKSKSMIVWRAAELIAQHKDLKKLKADAEELRKLRAQRREYPIMDIHKMEIDEIEKEFSNTTKYPDVESIKKAIKGAVPSKKLSKLRTRESIMRLIKGELERARSAREFSKMKLLEG